MLDQLDAAYVKMNSVEYVRQRKEMGLGRTRPVSVATLQAQLRPHETLVEFVLDTKASYAIEISRTNLKIQPLPSRAEISKLSRSFVTAIRSGADSKASGQALYKELIEPVMNRDISSLIVIPDGPLHLVPFSALVNAGGGYLSEVNLTAAPSASIYYTLSTTEKAVTARKPFLGVAIKSATESTKTSTRRLAALQICVPGASSRSVSRVRRLQKLPKSSARKA